MLDDGRFVKFSAREMKRVAAEQTRMVPAASVTDGAGVGDSTALAASVTATTTTLASSADFFHANIETCRALQRANKTYSMLIDGAALAKLDEVVDAADAAAAAAREDDEVGTSKEWQPSLSLRDEFYQAAVQAKSVVCCRLLPMQKKQVVLEIKQFGVSTLAIGDGANDEQMIRAADVGVGLLGKEGTAASRVSDCR
jgi:magnesium-transporting ATPase (P-type)